MEINYPAGKPLTPDEQALVEAFRKRLHERVATVGLTTDDVRHILEGLRQHPHASNEVVRVLMEEARTLLPGQRMVSFNWD
ncbi:MAG: hypothetical protein ER33_02800 [Cyanobium sp. CACIAM 14]|nr:MAG: hypothetical protein ER33_02800 [Cyanobium sp. CACIAM 14]